MNRLWPMLVVAVALIAMIANGGAQMDLDEPAIDIRGELEQIRARQGQSINAIRQSFYLGNLAISSKRYEAARLVYKQVVDIANSVPAGQRPLADPFRRRALMGTAILDMELYLDQPIRLKSYSSDSLARWELLRDVRDQFALLTQEQFAPVVAEAAVQRAYMFEMWDTGSLDSAALEVGDLRSLTTALSDLNVAVNLTAQADSEYAAVVVLKDREGLGEAPDLDVSRWVSVAQDRQHEVSLKQDTLHARAEAIQAMIIEQRFDAWYPDLKRTMETKIAELRTRGSGATDPFGDALLPKSFFDRAVAPRMFEGPLSVFDSHDSAASTAAMVMPHDWVALRREWESDVAWERRRVEANLMSAAIDDARRAPDTLQAHLQTWSHLGQSLPNGLETLFEPLPTEDDMGYLAGLAQQEGQAMWGDPSQTLAFEYVTERRQYETEMAQVQSEMASFRRVLEAFTPQRDGGGGDSLVKRYLATRDETLRLIWLNSDTLLTALLQLSNDIIGSRRSLMEASGGSIGAERRRQTFDDAVAWIVGLADVTERMDRLPTTLKSAAGRAPNRHVKRDLNQAAETLTTNSERLRSAQQVTVRRLIKDAERVYGADLDDPAVTQGLMPLLEPDSAG